MCQKYHVKICEEKVIEFQGEIHKAIIIVDECNTHLSVIDRSKRQKNQWEYKFPRQHYQST